MTRFSGTVLTVVAHLVRFMSLDITWVQPQSGGYWRYQVQDLQLLITEPQQQVLELRVSGEIDMGTVESLREAVRRSVASGDYKSLVIDLLGVGFIDSSGLHALVEARQAMLEAGGTATVVCSSPNLRKVFELTGLDGVLTIVDERTEAYATAA